MPSIKQFDDGSYAVHDDQVGVSVARFGGPGALAAGSRRYGGKMTLAFPVFGGVDTAGGLLSQQLNIFGNKKDGTQPSVIVERVVLDVTTQSSGACTVSAGIVNGAATSGANLIDTQSVAAVATLDNITDKGANGKSRQKATSAQFLTLSVVAGASAGLVGVLYVDVQVILP